MILDAEGWAAIGAIYAVWAFGLRPLMIDEFRSQVFALRHHLFMEAAKGRIAFDSDAYRAAETILNAFAQYAHKINALRLSMLFAFGACKLREPLEGVRLQKRIAMHPDHAVRKQVQMLVLLANLRAIKLALVTFLPTAILYFIAMHLVARVIRQVGSVLQKTAEREVKEGKASYIQEEAIISFRRHRMA